MKLHLSMSLAIWDYVEHTPALASATQAGTWFIYVGRPSWPRWSVACRDGLPTHRQSSVQVLTQQLGSDLQPVDHKFDAITTTLSIKPLYAI